MSTHENTYPVRFSVDYPDRPLNRVTTAFRIFVAIPIVIVLASVSGGIWEWSEGSGKTSVAGAGGLLFFGPLLMILFRQKYPRWWFDWNLELQRFTNRVAAYVAPPIPHRTVVEDGGGLAAQVAPRATLLLLVAEQVVVSAAEEGRAQR